MNLALQQPRDVSVDALRGLAVLGMVLSGSIAFGDVLPAWMFHAQVPPPRHQFNPSLPGITWVDWVFPFFLFAMGAAMPLAFARSGGASPSHRTAWATAIRRGAVLAALALFTHQLRANVQVASPGASQHVLAIVAFAVCGVALTAQIGKWRVGAASRVGAGFAGAALWLYVQQNNPALTLAKSDIILIVLANMAFFGTLLYAYTRHQPWLTVATLLFVGAVWLAGKSAGTPSHWLYSASALPWLYKFDYLKYLFVVVPGMFVGRWLCVAAAESSASRPSAGRHGVLAAMAICLLVGVTSGLFARSWPITLAVAGVGGATLMLATRNADATTRSVAGLSLYLLALGLALEPLAGGIKKDPSHFTYWLTTSALAGFALLALRAGAVFAATPMKWLAEVGQNPLPAYVAGNLLVLPLLHLSGSYSLWTAMKQNAAMGLLKGVLFTMLVAAITIAMVRARWVWRS